MVILFAMSLKWWVVETHWHATTIRWHPIAVMIAISNWSIAIAMALVKMMQTTTMFVINRRSMAAPILVLVITIPICKTKATTVAHTLAVIFRTPVITMQPQVAMTARV